MDRFTLHYREGAVGITVGPVDLDGLPPGVRESARALLAELVVDGTRVEGATPAERLETVAAGQATVFDLAGAIDARDAMHRLETLVRRTSSPGGASVTMGGSTLLPEDDEPDVVPAPPQPSVSLPVALAEAWRELGHRADPGKLRRVLEERLGESAKGEWRADLHLVVVAAQEGIPAKLMTAGSGRRALKRLVTDLAETRHWTKDAAQRAIDLWVATIDDPPDADP